MPGPWHLNLPVKADSPRRAAATVTQARTRTAAGVAFKLAAAASQAEGARADAAAGGSLSGSRHGPARRDAREMRQLRSWAGPGPPGSKFGVAG
jgi:hypothetical protein